MTPKHEDAVESGHPLRDRVPIVSSDTKAVIGTILGTGVGLTVIVTTLLGSQISGVHAELSTEIRSVRSELHDEIGTLRSEMRAEIQAVRGELRAELGGRIDSLGGRIDALRDEMRENHNRLDERLRAVETGLAAVNQRLDTLERAIIPSAAPTG